MKKYSLYLSLVIALGLVSCGDDDEQDAPDLTAPTIESASGRSAIRPEPGEIMPASKDHMHIRFAVSDASGISEVLVDVHSTFDGHSHGKTSTFERLSYRKIYDAAGATRLNIDGSADDLFWEGAASAVSGNVLAGPYHFSIQASDIHGNQTSAGDNSSYVAEFILERPYAPAISLSNAVNGELEGKPGMTLSVEGSIAKSSHSEASDLAFVWVRLAEEAHDDHDDDGHDHKKGGEIYEQMWGSSQSRSSLSGPALSSSDSLDLASLLSGSAAISLPSEDDAHYELIIWVEDRNGNISIEKSEVHAHD